MLDWWWRWREKKHHRPQPFPASLSWLLANPVSELQARSVLRLLDPAPGMRVLDAGAGPGRLTLPIAEAVGASGEVVALDLQQEMLQRLERRARERGLANVRTLRAGLGQGILAERDAFDRAVLVAVLGEVPVELREEGLREIRSALKPGGLLLVGEHFTDPDYRSPDTVRALGSSAGFEVTSEHRRPLGYVMVLRKPQ